MLEKTTITRALSYPSLLNNASVSRKGVGSSATSITTWRQYFDFDFRTLNQSRQVDDTLNGNNARLGVGRFLCHLGENVEASATLSKMCSNSSTGRLLILAMILWVMSGLNLKSLPESAQTRIF